MNYTADEVMQYAAEEDVKFVRLPALAFRAGQGNKNVLPHNLP